MTPSTLVPKRLSHRGKLLVSECSHCGRRQAPNGDWKRLVFGADAVDFSHGICPTCDAAVRAQILRNRSGIGSSVGGAV